MLNAKSESSAATMRTLNRLKVLIVGRGPKATDPKHLKVQGPHRTGGRGPKR